ncbi:MAG TPA: hypothetical protein VM939_03180 [Gemmatimonadaceae bacterium]|nr:hypothetical protein [Gemmatimonadaceae bacterium]
MTRTHTLVAATFSLSLITSISVGAQASAAGTQLQAAAEKVKKPRKGPFFETIEPLAITFTTDIRRIRGDKEDQAPWRTAKISYTAPDGKPVVIPAQVRTRGIWRLKTCEFPPIRINFTSEDLKGTLLQGLDKPKLVSYCKDNDLYEQYVLQELQLYRVYSLLTPLSHRARPLRVTYVDSTSGKTEATRYAFVIDEPAEVALRNKAKVLELKGARAEDLDSFHRALVGVFQYFIGNTDYSINGLHNAELIQTEDGIVFPIAYDFDFSGAVNARYATVDPSLSVRRVRERLMRGYCAEPGDFEKVFALFNEKKPAIWALYADPVGQLLRPKVVEETLAYFEDFYKTINNPRAAKQEIVDNCRK